MLKVIAKEQVYLLLMLTVFEMCNSFVYIEMCDS